MSLNNSIPPGAPPAQAIFQRAERAWESRAVPAFVSFELPCADTFLADRCPTGSHAQFVVRMSDGKTFARAVPSGAILMRGGYILGPAGTPIGFFRSIVGTAGTAFAAAAAPPNLAPDPFAPPSIATVVSTGRAYDATLQGVEMLEGGPAYHLTLRPLGDPQRLPLRDVWVDVRSFEVDALTYARKANEDAPQGTVHYEFAPVGRQPYWAVARIAAELPIGRDAPIARPQATLENVTLPATEPAWMFDPGLQP
ncbi:MAG TPA: hypothetical protein VGF98_06020 [Candidatus Tumulicola sp.]|jgi:hypothetical protein